MKKRFIAPLAVAAIAGSFLLAPTATANSDVPFDPFSPENGLGATPSEGGASVADAQAAIQHFGMTTSSELGGATAIVTDIDADPDLEIVTAPTYGSTLIRIWNVNGAFNVALEAEFEAFPGFTGGANISTGDVDGNGGLDLIVAARAGGGPHVVVFGNDTYTVIDSFFAFDPSFTGGVNLASYQISYGGGLEADIVVGAGPGGGPHVKVIDAAGNAELFSFFPYDTAFTGGVTASVAIGATIATAPGAGGGPEIKVYETPSMNLLANFWAYDPAFTGGVDVDFCGGGYITGPGVGGGPEVRTFDLLGVPDDAGWAYDPSFRGGINVSACLSGVAVGPIQHGGNHIIVMTNLTPAVLNQSFFAY